MKLTSTDAKKLLDEIYNEDTKGWIAHCICVGDTAFKIAKELKEKGMDIDPDKAKTMGYIHDIGKIKDDSSHTISGYYYLKERGIDEEYRKSIYKEPIPEPEFINMYLDAICDNTLNKEEKLQRIKELFNYAKKDVSLDEKDYRILIKSRNSNR